ncbi:hypothetical protein E2C01_071431 [Portunus trituberculatus]|uniref:Uncharacterized protein n=1 Tax=Portunus trituberculatus TaxID=210409 RepID=A0A5B7I874_PORTR|nr:hypothetical protein [Portunus trituberculatus]
MTTCCANIRYTRKGQKRAERRWEHQALRTVWQPGKGLCSRHGDRYYTTCELAGWRHGHHHHRAVHSSLLVLENHRVLPSCDGVRYWTLVAGHAAVRLVPDTVQ